MAENVKSNFWIYYAWLLAGLVAVMVEADNRCTAQTSCSECIRIPSCAWCSPSVTLCHVDVGSTFIYR